MKMISRMMVDSEMIRNSTIGKQSFEIKQVYKINSVKRSYPVKNGAKSMETFQ